MAGRTVVKILMEQLKDAFQSYRASDGLENILMAVLERFSDDDVRLTTTHLVATQDRSPPVSAILQAAQVIAAQRALRDGLTAAPKEPEYWDRSPAERAVIDEARAEFRRVWKALDAGTPVADLFPADSEPCRLARAMAAKRGETVEQVRHNMAPPVHIEPERPQQQWGPPSYDW